MPEEFRIEREVVLEATPEDVFAAVTDGTSGWLFPTPPVGPDEPAVRVWEPPNRVTVRVDGPDGWFNALEHVIEARDGGTAVLRYVHSGVFVDDWDNQYDGAAKHTTFYLHSLGLYLRYFAGRPVTYVCAKGPQESAKPDSFRTLLAALDLESRAVGDPVTIEPAGLPRIDAVVDYRDPHFLGLRAADALYRFYGRDHFGGTVDLGHHLFGPDANGPATEQAWNAWLDTLFRG
jgi:hypothetical protein